MPPNNTQSQATQTSFCEQPEPMLADSTTSHHHHSTLAGESVSLVQDDQPPRFEPSPVDMAPPPPADSQPYATQNHDGTYNPPPQYDPSPEGASRAQNFHFTSTPGREEVSQSRLVPAVSTSHAQPSMTFMVPMVPTLQSPQVTNLVINGPPLVPGSIFIAGPPVSSAAVFMPQTQMPQPQPQPQVIPQPVIPEQPVNNAPFFIEPASSSGHTTISNDAPPQEAPPPQEAAPMVQEVPTETRQPSPYRRCPHCDMIFNANYPDFMNHVDRHRGRRAGSVVQSDHSSPPLSPHADDGGIEVSIATGANRTMTAIATAMARNRISPEQQVMNARRFSQCRFCNMVFSKNSREYACHVARHQEQHNQMLRRTSSQIRHSEATFARGRSGRGNSRGREARQQGPDTRSYPRRGRNTWRGRGGRGRQHFRAQEWRAEREWEEHHDHGNDWGEQQAFNRGQGHTRRASMEPNMGHEQLLDNQTQFYYDEPSSDAYDDQLNIREDPALHHQTTVVTCNICNRSFSYLPNYQRHYNNCHNFVCRNCGQRLISRNALKLHLRTQHPRTEWREHGWPDYGSA